MFPQSTIYVFYLPWLHIAQKCVLFRSTGKREMDVDGISTYWPSSSANNSKAFKHLMKRLDMMDQGFHVHTQISKRHCQSHYRHRHWLCPLNQEHIHKLFGLHVQHDLLKLHSLKTSHSSLNILKYK